MTGKEKFLNFISSMNDFSIKFKYNSIREFVCYDDTLELGILKKTVTLSDCIKVHYALYVFSSLFDDFVVVRCFEKLSSAEKAFDVLTSF